jgi:hypothetical protein
MYLAVTILFPCSKGRDEDSFAENGCHRGWQMADDRFTTYHSRGRRKNGRSSTSLTHASINLNITVAQITIVSAFPVTIVLIKSNYHVVSHCKMPNWKSSKRLLNARGNRASCSPSFKDDAQGLPCRVAVGYSLLPCQPSISRN